MELSSDSANAISHSVSISFVSTSFPLDARHHSSVAYSNQRQQTVTSEAADGVMQRIVRLSKIIDSPATLSAAIIFNRDSSFWRYKVYADIRGDSKKQVSKNSGVAR